MKQLFKCFGALVILACASQGWSQRVITITKDTVITTTWELTENTIIQGSASNRPTVTFQGIPKIIANNCIVLVKNIKMNPKKKWGTIKGAACLEWYGLGMRGSMNSTLPKRATFLDGTPR